MAALLIELLTYVEKKGQKGIAIGKKGKKHI